MPGEAHTGFIPGECFIAFIPLILIQGIDTVDFSESRPICVCKRDLRIPTLNSTISN